MTSRTPSYFLVCFLIWICFSRNGVCFGEENTEELLKPENFEFGILKLNRPFPVVETCDQACPRVKGFVSCSFPMASPNGSGFLMDFSAAKVGGGQAVIKRISNGYPFLSTSRRHCFCWNPMKTLNLVEAKQDLSNGVARYQDFLEKTMQSIILLSHEIEQEEVGIELNFFSLTEYSEIYQKLQMEHNTLFAKKEELEQNENVPGAVVEYLSALPKQLDFEGLYKKMQPVGIELPSDFAVADFIRTIGEHSKYDADLQATLDSFRGRQLKNLLTSMPFTCEKRKPKSRKKGTTERQRMPEPKRKSKVSRRLGKEDEEEKNPNSLRKLCSTNSQPIS